MEQLIESGLSIKDALEVTANINSKKGKKDDISTAILEKINKGISFTSAINELPEIFPSVYRGIISVGDRVGSVEKIFPRLRIYLETKKKLRDKLVGAMIYPVTVLITAVLVFIGMLFFVFPKLKMMFSEFGGEAAVILENNISKMETGLMTFFIFIMIMLLIIVITNVVSKRNDKIKMLKDTLLLKIPFVGKFITYLETLNFTFAMETLTAGGVTIENAIKESKTVISNEKYKSALEDVNRRIQRGENLSDAFSIHNVFPSYVSKWMSVGEKSGKPELIFTQIRNYFQNEIDLYTTKFMTMIEPALVIIIGIFLIILVITVIVPVFSLYGAIL